MKSDGTFYFYSRICWGLLRIASGGRSTKPFVLNFDFLQVAESFRKELVRNKSSFAEYAPSTVVVFFFSALFNFHYFQLLFEMNQRLELIRQIVIPLFVDIYVQYTPVVKPSTQRYDPKANQ